MITRKVDKEDSLAGFAYDWVKKIGEHLDKLYVITWQKSNQENLPENIKVISLFGNKLRKIIILQKELWQILPKVDGLFCHMNPEYTILSAPLAKFFRKKILTWYTHGSVSWKLKLVNSLADKILTASEESCRLKNRKKIKIVGHGINTDYFKKDRLEKIDRKKFVILSVARISPTKNYETLIEAIDILVNQKDNKNLEVQIIGSPGLKEQETYLNNLKKIVVEKKLEDYIKFLGPVAYAKILPYYLNANLFINLSETGSVDKAVLEAMSCECLVLTSNEAFINILKDGRLIFKKRDSQNLAQKIIDLINLNQKEKKEIKKRLREKIIKDYNLNKLAKKILYFYEK